MADERPLVVLCAGGHACVLIDALQRAGRSVLCCLDDDPARHGTQVLGVAVAGAIGRVADWPSDQVVLVNGKGSTDRTHERAGLFERFGEQGYTFATVVHPSAVVSESAQVGQGAQVLAGAVVGPRTLVGANALINTRASVDHDCVLGSHSHVAPGATLSGSVRVGDGAHVGAGATVIQGLAIGAGALVAAGAVVVQDVAAEATVLGIPARVRPHGA